jgi:hypothetical protein
MLRKWPNPNKLSEKSAWAGGLWIRRVLVRAQEGQLKAPHRVSRSRRFPYLRLMAEQSSRPVAYPLRSSCQVCMMIII